MEPSHAALIGLDWGTSRLRAYLFDAEGAVAEFKDRPWGVLSPPDGGFERAYHDVTGEWHARRPGLPAVACGMIGSTVGWVAAPYCACPAGLQELAAAVVAATTQQGVIHVIPGVELRGATPDVMRGEETQIAGALALHPDLAASGTFVLPGTHAKWVAVRDGRIARFTTYLTGELFALLSERSILSRPPRTAVPAGAGEVAWDTFERGVRAARDNRAGGIAPLLFRTRSLVVQGALRAEESLEYLSGLLIGDEIRSGSLDATPELALVGETALCERYQRALRLFDIAAPVVDGATPAGLWQIAGRLGLVSAAATRG